jgi:iron complex transport system ATP-binding protein
MSAVSLNDVTVRLSGRTVLESVDATFAPGRLTVVIGPNGAGKSTLLQVAAGLRRPNAGMVTIDGTPMADVPRKRLAKRRAYLPQSPAIEWAISVERVVALGLTAHLPAFGALPSSWKPEIEQALARYDLVALRDRPATRLSGGELARVMLARATVGSPDILIADEPTTGLDPRHALDAARRLRKLADEGKTVVVALHDLDLALRVADDVVALKDGRVMAAGPAGEMFTEATLGALYELDTRVTRNDNGVTIRFL